MNQKRKNRIDKLLRLIYPPRCAVCDELMNQEDFASVHKECLAGLFLLTDPICLRCGKKITEGESEYCYDCVKKRRYPNPVMEGRGIFEYKGQAKLMMYRFKYNNRSCYSHFFVKQAMEQRGRWLTRQTFDAIIPVPMNKRKQKRRGYNQAEEFAKALAASLGVKMDAKLVTRRKNTKALKTLSPEERKNNLKNAFHVTNSIVEYRKILLVDDIYTTGSTIEAVADVLTKAGVEEIYFFTVCIGIGF